MEVFGGVVGLVIVWIMYVDYFKVLIDEILFIIIWNLFCMVLVVCNLLWNFFVELFDIFIFILGILVIFEIKMLGIVLIGVGLFVWVIGMGFGGLIGFVMNLV